MISGDAIRGYIDIIILSLLIEDDSYGYEISKQIRDRTNERYIIKETTLYSAFTRLEKAGLISPYFGEVSGGKRRTYYKITDDGREFYYLKCEEWKLTKEVVDCFCNTKQADGQ